MNENTWSNRRHKLYPPVNHCSCVLGVMLRSVCRVRARASILSSCGVRCAWYVQKTIMQLVTLTYLVGDVVDALAIFRPTRSPRALLNSLQQCIRQFDMSQACASLRCLNLLTVVYHIIVSRLSTAAARLLNIANILASYPIQRSGQSSTYTASRSSRS